MSFSDVLLKYEQVAAERTLAPPLSAETMATIEEKIVPYEVPDMLKRYLTEISSEVISCWAQSADFLAPELTREYDEYDYGDAGGLERYMRYEQEWQTVETSTDTSDTFDEMTEGAGDACLYLATDGCTYRWCMYVEPTHPFYGYVFMPEEERPTRMPLYDFLMLPRIEHCNSDDPGEKAATEKLEELARIYPSGRLLGSSHT